MGVGVGLGVGVAGGVSVGVGVGSGVAVGVAVGVGVPLSPPPANALLTGEVTARNATKRTLLNLPRFFLGLFMSEPDKS